MHTITVRRLIAAPIDVVFDWLVDANNYRAMPGVIRVHTHPDTVAEPNGVGALREITNLAMKVTEEITAYDRPRHLGYVFRSSIPPMEHDGATMSFRETSGATEVSWTTKLELKTPVLSRLLTRMYLLSLAIGMRMLFRAADRTLTR